ncbi:MAG: dihydrolipoyllysine-residue succinyltransferase, partial [Oligoflexia bacterium]|nr:dihydrolipoyllysine-residue succinyltransferase [Oligoflexia bacterium]
VSVDEVIAFIDTNAQQPQEKSPSDKAPSDQKLKNQDLSTKEDSKELKRQSFSKISEWKEALSPSVRRLVETKELNPSQIAGTGKGGRLTKTDILKALNEKIESEPINELSSSDTFSPQKEDGFLQKGQRREPMTRLRRVTAEKLVQSQHNTATLSTFNEADLSRIIEIRKNYQADFVQKYGHKLGFMSFFVKAVVSALKKYPKINAFIEGDNVVYNDHQHIGIAVSTEKGLVVPVLFYAETLTLAQIEKKIMEYRDKALSRKLTPDDLLGGTFTISNGGVFGSLLSTPILNPPQSGILGMHKIEERPVVRNGEIEIRPMMYLTLSYDHRIVDGRESVGFLVKVKEGLEEPARLLIDL